MASSNGIGSLVTAGILRDCCVRGFKAADPHCSGAVWQNLPVLSPTGQQWLDLIAAAVAVTRLTPPLAMASFGSLQQ